MFKSSTGAQRRYYRTMGDGSAHFNTFHTPKKSPCEALTRTDRHGFRTLTFVPAEAGEELHDDSEAPVLLSSLDTAPLRLFDARRDPASPQPQGLSACPGGLLDETLSAIRPAGRGRFVHDLLDAWVFDYRGNLKRLCRLIFDLAERETNIALGIATAATGADCIDWPQDGNLIAYISGGLAISVTAAFAVLHRQRRDILVDAFKAATRASSAVVFDQVKDLQVERIEHIRARRDGLALSRDTFRGSDPNWTDALEPQVRTICADMRRLSDTREKLRISMRRVGMSTFGDAAKIEYAMHGWAWRTGTLAVGLIPKSAARFLWLIGLLATCLTPIVAHALTGHVDGPGLARHGIGAGIVALAWAAIVFAQAGLRPRIDPATACDITLEASFQTVKGPADVDLGGAVATLLVTLGIRLLNEEDRRR